MDLTEDPVKRADRILADAREQKAAMIPKLLLLMKHQKHSAWLLVADPAAPFGFRVEDNPFSDALPPGCQGAACADQRPLDRIAAIVALGELKTPQALPDLLLAFDDADGLPAVHAAEVLVRLGSRAGVPVLITALEHKAYENENANRILQKLSGQDFGFDSDSGMTARWAAIKRWRDWWDGFQKTGAKLAGEGEPYKKGADPDADRRIARWVNVCGEGQVVYMEQSRRMLTRLGPPAVPFLEEGLARAAGPAHTWRAEIALVLGGIADPASHRLLEALLADPHPSVRSRAVAGLVRSGAPSAAERLRAALKDGDSSVVLAAVRGLATVGTPADAALLAAIQSPEAEVSVAVDCARLKLAPSPETFDAVARHVLGSSIARRTPAIDALNAFAGRVVLEDPNAPEDARKAAVEEWRKALPK